MTYLVTPEKGIPLSIFVFAPQRQNLLLYMNKIVQTLSDGLIPGQREYGARVQSSVSRSIQVWYLVV